MFLEKAKEVVRFAMKRPLLQPQIAPPPEGRFGLVTRDLDEAFQLYGLPVRKPAEAQRMGLLYPLLYFQNGFVGEVNFALAN